MMMKRVRFLGAVLAFCGSGLSVPSAWAGELLVMPFQCQFVDGRPSLVPSEQIGHRVISRREDRDLTVCSPVDSQRCRNFKVHRFTVDCGGVEVPWVALAAASPAARNGRAYLDGGRLHIRMPAAWTMAPDDPCVRELPAGPGWQAGRMSRYCSDRAALSPPPFVEMPVGFAPMLGIDAIFVPDDGPQAAAQPPAREPGVPQASKKKLAPADALPRTAAAPVPQPLPPATKPVEAQSQANPTTGSAVKPTDGATSAAAPPPLALVDQGAASSAPTGQAPPAPPSSTVGTERQTVAPSPSLTTSGAASDSRPPSLRSGSELTRLLFAGDGVALLLGPPVALLLGVLAWMAFRRRTETGDDDNLRDPFALSLGMTTGTAVAVHPRGPASMTAVPPHQDQPPALVDWPTAVPQSREDALRVLGMGVSADASSVALKKMVDALRMSWHPDHARDEADLAIREQRIRQINAAWDIISREPAEGSA